MLEIGTLVDGKYKILSEIGRGGMSVVYMAINEKANKTWAIKEVRKDGVIDYEAVKQGLIVETDMLKKLNHPHLPSIVDVIDDEESFIIVMDYIEGHSLAKALNEYGAQPQESVIEWSKQLCDVLGYLHSRTPPIIYRDMKPANVMLKPDGNIMVIDFGTAREFKERNLADTTCLGTIGYAAPEQYGNNGQTDARTDIFGLGATMHHLLTGENPTPTQERKPIRQINPSLSAGLEKIIEKCTRPNPDERYQSAEELMYALENFEYIDDKYRKKQKKRLSIFIAAVIGAVLFAAAGIVLGFFATQMATDTYAEMIDEADRTDDREEKIRLYEECIALPGKQGDITAYLKLIDTYKADSRFTVDESKNLNKLVTNNKSALEADMDSYVRLCYEIGKIYWYNYIYDDDTSADPMDSKYTVSRAGSSIVWFQTVTENGKESDDINIDLAKAYMNIGMFYRDIQQKEIEGSDGGEYRTLFDNFRELMELVGRDESESSRARLDIVIFADSTMQMYPTNFKGDGVTREEMDEFLDYMEQTLDMINVESNELLASKKEEIKSHFADARERIDVAYTTKGSD